METAVKVDGVYVFNKKRVECIKAGRSPSIMPNSGIQITDECFSWEMVVHTGMIVYFPRPFFILRCPPPLCTSSLVQCECKAGLKLANIRSAKTAVIDGEEVTLEPGIYVYHVGGIPHCCPFEHSGPAVSRPIGRDGLPLYK